MSRNDLIALSVSLGVHALLLLLGLSAVFTFGKELVPEQDIRMVEIEFGPSPVRPVVEGPPEAAPEGAASDARTQPEPPRPAPPAASPVRVPERPRATPPRPSPPIARAPQADTPPRRPSPPSPRRDPEPTPTPPQQPRTTTGNGSSDGPSANDGPSTDGDGRGSGGTAEREVGFQFGNRDWNCPAIPPADGASGRIEFVLTFAPNGRYVSARPTRRNAALEAHVRRYLSGCRADPLPPNAAQRNDRVSAGFTVR